MSEPVIFQNMTLQFMISTNDFADFNVKNPLSSLIYRRIINIKKANSNGCQTLCILLLLFRDCSTARLKKDLKGTKILTVFNYILGSNRSH